MYVFFLNLYFKIMETEVYTAKDFISDQEVKWCPGCGDYSILKQMQSILPEINIPKEKIVFVSGIGCSSRFPYYMNTFGMHSIHGRAPAVATGMKLANPELNIWLITGDGDGLSIGGNHLIHLFRRNVDINVLMFNNEIYGLTKGQYSPTSNEGLRTKSSPMGVVDHPFNPLSLALGSSATFVARTLDRNPIHLREMLKRSQEHKGTSFLEIYQNCIIFNDAIFEDYSNKETKNKASLYLEHGKPLLFGKNNEFAVILEGFSPKIVSVFDVDENQLWIHDERDKTKAYILTQMFDNPLESGIPRPFGVLYSEDRTTYNDSVIEQIKTAKKQKTQSINDLIAGNNTWVVE